MFTLPGYVIDLMKNFQSQSFEIYLVGGAVRDLLLKRSTENWDFTTNATPEQIIKLYPDSFYNNQFGTVGIPVEIEGKTIVMEVTTFRTESEYADRRRPNKIEWSDSLEEDLARRDFTINAIALAYNESESDPYMLMDPFNGKKDIESKEIRAVGDPDKRFGEDALRLLRGVRIATELQFQIEKGTLDSMTKNANHILEISNERIRDELLRIVCSPYAADGIELLRATTLLKYILPELDNCFGVDQVSPNRHHIYDVGTHLVMALRHSPSHDPITRLATLLHDIGKVKTYRKEEATGQITFYNHEVVGEQQVKEIAVRLRLSNKDKDKLITLVRHHQFTVSEDQTDKAVRRFIRDIGIDNVNDMLDLRTADRLGSGATETSWRLDLFKKRIEEVQKQPFSIKDLKINGEDVMRELTIQPGKKVGEILNQLFTEVEEGTLKNIKEDLLQRTRSLA